MLGRGLESLIPPQHQQNQPVTGQAASTVNKTDFFDGPVFHIEVANIKPNPYQPRKHFDPGALDDLAASIREFGIMQPLMVSKVEVPGEHGVRVEYQLIAGERRLLAAKMVGLPQVPVVVRKNPEEREKLELAIVENLQRENLNPIESARAYAKLQDHFGLTQREIAVRLGKSREVIGNAVRLLSLPSYIQESLGKNQLSESQARLLLVVDNTMQQQQLFNDIVQNNLSVRELKSRIARARNKNTQDDEGVTDPEFARLEAELQETLGAKVKLQKQGNAGKILIDFSSIEELRNILQKIGNDESDEPMMMKSEASQATDVQV